jgi:hypothetical protein
MQEWRKDRFHRVTLHALGLRFQLGHCVGESCSASTQARGAFTVVHTNGIHAVNVDFCRCSGQVDKQIQLLKVGWWPATCLEPRSAVTFDALKTFHLLNLHGSLAAIEYYRTLEDLTNGDGLRRGTLGKESEVIRRKGKRIEGREKQPVDPNDIPPVYLQFLSPFVVLACSLYL